MELPLRFVLLAGGLALGLAGVHIERPAVMLLGFVPGAMLAATFAPRFVTGVEEPTLTAVVAVAALLGGIVGAAIAWRAWILVHAIPGFVAGVFLAAPVFGVRPETAFNSPGIEVAFVLGAGLAGAVLAWAIHRLFVAVFTAAVGAGMVSVVVFGEDVYLPAAEALLERPEPELRAVVESATNLGTPTVGLAVVFALVQIVSLGDAVRSE
jgi:hypothetical protein